MDEGHANEGRGPTLLMVQGTPSWSFLYRQLICELSSEYRCVAPDQLGFGLSDKPTAFAYTPAAHAENLKAFIDTLELDAGHFVQEEVGREVTQGVRPFLKKAVRKL